MKVLIIGSGGREHAIAAKIKESKQLTAVYAAPGSDGMSDIAEKTGIAVTDNEGILAFVKEKGIDMVFIGPEVPLLNGLADLLLKENVMVLGPQKDAAELEGSKAFCKHMMKKYDIPTAAYEVFDDMKAALAYLQTVSYPTVVKADGLAAGKGVIIAADEGEAAAAVKSMMEDKVFGDSGSRVVIEEFLKGEELSLLAFTDGETVVPMLPSQDHKRIDDDDMGPNTGGMGAYAPAPVGSPEIIEKAMEQVLKPMVRAMKEEGRPYRGVLYAGLMVDGDDVKVLEFNARFGDPETQAVLPLLDSDILDIARAINEGTLSEQEIRWKDGYAVCVVISAKGYPASPVKGDVISGLDQELEDTFVFHAGTKLSDGSFVSNGGRVLGVTALAPELKAAIDKAYARVETIDFKECHYRHDIGRKAFRHLQ